MAPAPKLSEQDVKRLRSGVHAGEHLTDLAREFSVDRKTIRRRLDALERAEAERGKRLAAKRVRRQAAQGKLKLLERDKNFATLAPIAQTQRSERAGSRDPDPRLEWFDTPKNLSGRAHAEASGLVRVRDPDGTRRVWRDRAEVEALLDEGWRLDE